MGKKILISQKIPKEAVEIARNNFEVDYNEDENPLPPEELKKRLKDKNGIVCLLTDIMNGEVMDAAPNLEVISNVAVGYDNIDVNAATERKIAVTNTPGVLTDTTADLAWSLIMSVARRIAEADKHMRSGKWKGWGVMQWWGSDVHHATLGILGFGRIGKVVAKRALGFEMKVLYHDAFRAPEEEEKALKATFVSKEILLKESDFVSVHVPLMPETVHIIGENELKMMKPTAFLINTSRGPTVDEKALVKALKNKEIAGAGLDVYEKEPVMEPELADMDNVVVLPHIASASIKTRTRMGTMAAENCVAALKEEIPPACVNPEIYKK
ncbi:MAG TPA: D-glycerate dehydrogenase [Nitrospinota bacterium]|nr:D-glycerate dehydrogenase [Nitrospinota bacterium]